MKQPILLLLSLSFMTLTTYKSVADSLLNASLGYEQTTGSYDQESNTDITTTPLNIQYINNAWRFRLSIPTITVTGDGTVIPGSNGTIESNSPSGRGSSFSTSETTTETTLETQSGLGDIISSLSYAFTPLKNNYMFYELTGEIKFGTASASKNLGTGENDYSLDLYSVFEKHAVRPFITVGYLLMGDTEIADYNDVFFASTGFMYPFNNKTLLNMSYDFQQTTMNENEDSRTANIYISRQLDPKWSANIYLSSGLSNSVADTGIGFTIAHTL